KGRLIRRRDRAPFWLAGVWDRWIGPDGSEVESCCVLTTAPNALVRPLHDRMPVVVPDGLEEAWMAPADGQGLRALEPLMAGWDPGGWELVEPPAADGTRQLSLLG
ncbi:MAG: SOS response-associated peptidase family protein, partial [Vulcanococcus sp.]